jgi:hypothetical protein
MVNAFIQWLSSPLSEWHIASLQHKLVVGAVGAGVGYYLWKYKKVSGWKLALYSLLAAYGTSAVLHAAKRFEVPTLPPGVQVPPTFPQSVPMTAPIQQGVPSEVQFTEGPNVVENKEGAKDYEEDFDEDVQLDGIFG